MVNTLALLLSPEERQRSRYAVETLSSDLELYDSDLFVQGMLKVHTVLLEGQLGLSTYSSRRTKDINMFKHAVN